MKTSKNGLLAIIAEEAIVLSAYKDSGGVWTLGIGHTAAAGEPRPRAGMKVTIEEALELFARDVSSYENRVTKAVGPMKQHQFDALVGFDFNTGAILSGTVDDKIKAGQFTAAMKTLQAYDKDNGKKLAGLDKRRDVEENMWWNGIYPKITHLKVYDKYPGKVRLVPVSEIDLDKAFKLPSLIPDAVAPGEAKPQKPRGLLLALIEFLVALFGGKKK